VTAAVAAPPLSVAVMSAWPSAFAATGKSAYSAPAGTFTFGGTDTIEGLLEVGATAMHRFERPMLVFASIAAATRIALSSKLTFLHGTTMATLEINLPDSLAKEAEQAGLLTSEAIEQMVREAIRRRALVELKEAMERMAAVEGPVMTPEEIEEEIQAARAERRAREARAAGT